VATKRSRHSQIDGESMVTSLHIVLNAFYILYLHLVFALALPIKLNFLTLPYTVINKFVVKM
jgi:hypothetical protein